MSIKRANNFHTGPKMEKSSDRRKQQGYALFHKGMRISPVYTVWQEVISWAQTRKLVNHIANDGVEVTDAVFVDADYMIGKVE